MCCLILSAEILPPLPVYLHFAHSLSVGTTLAAIIAVSFLTLGATIRSHQARDISLLDARANGLLIGALLIGLVFLHGFAASSYTAIDYHRFSISLAILCILLAGGAAIGLAFRTATPEDLNSASWICFWFFAGVILLRLLKLEPDAQAFPKAMFPYTETSHFALAFGPIYLYRCVTAHRRNRLFWILFGFTLALVLKSATLIAFALGAAVLSRRLTVTLLVTLIGVVAGAASHLSYFAERAELSTHSSNLSALVYLQGWQFVIHSLELSHGWGLGFQQLGVHPFHLAVTRIIQQLANGTPLNSMGGSFIFSKLASEFGIFGILLGIVYLYYTLQTVKTIRNCRTAQRETLPRCIVIAFGVDMFLRGTGYFYGAPLLFLASIVSLWRPPELLRRHHSSQNRTLVAIR